MSRDLKLTYRILLVMLLAAEALALTGIVRAPHSLWLAELSIANIGTYALFVVVLYVFSRPSSAEAGKAAIAGVALAALALYLEFRWTPVRPAWDWVFVASAGFGAAALALLLVRLRRGTGDPRLTRDLLAASGIAPLADPTVSAYLHLTEALHPVTFDLGAYQFDAMLGFQPSATLALIAQNVPWLLALLGTAYHFQPYGISMLYAMQRVAPRPPPFSIIAFQAVSALLSALLLYHLYPVAGPAYAFGAAFPAALPAGPELDAIRSLVTRGARNGVPSMHFAWALALWLSSRALGVPWVRALFAAWLGLTVLSTLALGEHYLVDLVVAVPLVIGVVALCALDLPWRGSRARAVWVGMGLTLAWIALLRFGAGILAAAPLLAWPAVIGTVVASVTVYSRFERLTAGAESAPASPAAAIDATPAVGREIRYAGLMFVLSGFAALVYQVVFSKALALTFGSQATATYTVLAVYMGGMALGAWLGGWLAARRSDPLKLYGWCELGVGAYCLCTPLVFMAIQALYVAAAGGIQPDAGTLTVLRVTLGAAALLVPTVLMGATLPVLARYCEMRAAPLGISVAWLYCANTVGAAFGALLAGYLIIPALGVWKTTLAAAALNLAIAWLAFALHGRTRRTAAELPFSGSSLPVADPEARRLGLVALVVLAVGGAVTLALEVNYIHLLAVVAGNSVYAFALMLFAFLLGLAGGAECSRWLLRLRLNLAAALAWLQFALAAVVLTGVYLWEGMPAYFASFESHLLTREFGAREVVRATVCLAAMLPPAFVIGAAYPLAMECVGRAYARTPIAALGRAAALNTAGNIAGVLAAGFWLLPAIGALRSIQLAAALCLALGVTIVAATGLWRRPLAWAPAAAVAALLAVQPRAFDYTALASGANVYFAPQSFGRVLDHAESADGGLTTVTAGDGRGALRVLLTNGKFQGTNDLGGEAIAQTGFALSPLMHTGARQSALVIGYGTGMSARVLHDAGFAELEIADLSRDIVRLANEHFGDVNGGVMQRAGVRTYITDGRNFLLLHDRRYDVVNMEVTSIWFAGAASLYNREFYQLAKRRLAPEGVLQQWVQLHHIHPRDVLYILGSVRSEFRYVWIYEIGGQGIIIASNSPAAAPRPEYIEQIDRTRALAPILKLHGGTAGKLTGNRLLDPDGVDRLLGSFKLPPEHWVSTDDNLILEYSTPRGNVLDGTLSFARNVELLRSHAAPRKGGAGAKAP
jgi:predicted membrane-bound spermidine synthase